MPAEIFEANGAPTPRSFAERVQPPASQGEIKVTLYGASVMEMIYRQLAECLKDGEQEFTLVNEATSGHKSFDGLEKLERICQSEADVVVVSFGGNDLRHGFTIDQIRENMRTIIGGLQDAGKEVVLVGIDPSDLMHILQEGLPESDICHDENDPFLTSIRELYQGLTDEFGIRVFKKSLHSGLGREDLMEDGIHPTDSGIEKIADDLSSHIRHAAVHVKASRRIEATPQAEQGLGR